MGLFPSSVIVNAQMLIPLSLVGLNVTPPRGGGLRATAQLRRYLPSDRDHRVPCFCAF